MRFDALIFDLDGTLWDTTVPVARAWTSAMSALGRDKKAFSAQDVSRIMGMPHKQILETILPEEQEEKREKIATEFYKHEEATLRSEGGRLYPGVEEGIKELAACFPLYIVSNCQQNYIETFFAVTQLKRFFQDWECHGATGLTKGENIRLIIDRHGLKTAAYIGDTSGDQEAALYAKAAFFHVEYGFGKPSRRCETFSTFSDLVKYFQNQR